MSEGTGMGRKGAASRDDVRELRALLCELIELNLHLVDFGERAAARLKITRRDLVALLEIVESGPVTAGHISRRLRLTSGAATGVINRLEAAGHAARAVNPRDGRSVMVHPTPSGREVVGVLWEDATRALGREVESGDGPELAELVAGLRAAGEALRRGQTAFD